MSQPEWVTRRWPEFDNNSTLDIITEIYRIRRIALFNNKKLAQLRGGYVLNDFLKHLLNASKGVFDEANKMLLYSAVRFNFGSRRDWSIFQHDGTLLALMYTLGIGDYQLVPYASALIFELYEDGSNNYYVKVINATNR